MSEHPAQWIYILHCQRNRLYTGFTTDMIKRYRSHLDGTGKAKFTRSFKPLKIAQCWRLENAERGTALKVEAFIKKQHRRTKAGFIQEPESLAVAFERTIDISVTLVPEDIAALEQKARESPKR